MRRGGEEGRTYILHLEPHVRAWWARPKEGKGSEVRMQGEGRNIADGTAVRLIVALKGGSGEMLCEAEGTFAHGRVVGDDGANGIPYALEFVRKRDEGAEGLVFTLEVPEYRVKTESNLLPLRRAALRVSQ